MRDGCYDEEGICVNCGEYHPCACEVEIIHDDDLIWDDIPRRKGFPKGEW